MLLHRFLVFRLRLGEHLTDLLLFALHFRLDLKLHRLHLLLCLFLKVLLDLLNHGNLGLEYFFDASFSLLGKGNFLCDS